MNPDVIQMIQEDELINTQRKLAVAENNAALFESRWNSACTNYVDALSENKTLNTKLTYLEGQYAILLDKLLGKI